MNKFVQSDGKMKLISELTSEERDEVATRGMMLALRMVEDAEQVPAEVLYGISMACFATTAWMDRFAPETEESEFYSSDVYQAIASSCVACFKLGRGDFKSD